MDIEARIRDDIEKFNGSVKKFEKSRINQIKEEDLLEVFKLAKMYASDSESWLKKKDYYTAFASIAYAHGLLDALLKLLQVG